jgi:hypothetical protein
MLKYSIGLCLTMNIFILPRKSNISLKIIHYLHADIKSRGRQSKQALQFWAHASLSAMIQIGYDYLK